jgi:hypothetical protein
VLWGGYVKVKHGSIRITERVKSFATKTLLLGTLMGLPSCGARTGPLVNESESDGGASSCSDREGTNVLADFQASLPELHFETDLSFSLGMTISLDSGEIVSGDPHNIRHGDAVCSGAVLRLAPSVDARWAGCDLEIVSPFPFCEGPGYCPRMIEHSDEISREVPIAWLDDGGENLRFGQFNNVSTNTARRASLGVFHDQPVTYSIFPEESNPGKEGGANVFCNGSFVVSGTRIEELEIARFALPELREIVFDTGEPGGITFRARIENPSCFAAVEKHPLDLDHTEYYRLYYFSHNGPVLPEALGGVLVNIQVRECR